MVLSFSYSFPLSRGTFCPQVSRFSLLILFSLTGRLYKKNHDISHFVSRETKKISSSEKSKGRDLIPCYHLYLQTTHIVCLEEYSRSDTPAYDNGMHFRHSLLGNPFGVKLKEVFTEIVHAPLIRRQLSVWHPLCYYFLSQLFLITAC